MTTFTPEQKLTIVKHLAAGKTASVVSGIMQASEAAIVEVAKHHGYPDVQKLKWAVDIMQRNLDAADQPTESKVPDHATRIDQRPGASTASTGATQPLTRPDEIRVLINTAKAHPSKRIQAQGNRVIDAIDKLKTLIAEDQEKNAEKRRVAEEKAAARARVERLESELKAAKAELRGKPAPTPAPAPASAAAKPKSTTAPRGEYPCRNEGCDEIKDTPQGRSLHERRHCAHRVQEAS